MHGGPMATPQAPESVAPPPSPGAAPEPRRLSTGHGTAWWGEGWRIFAAAPLMWIGIVLVFFVLMLVMVLVPLIGSLAQTLLFPVFWGGTMLGCDALAR